jgi:NADH dehydrogenase
MRIAITGAAGFVGSHLTTRLVSEGHEVVRLARRPRSGVADIVVSRLDDVNQLIEAFAGCDAVAHCAGINRELGDQTYERVHVEGTRNVVEAAKAAGVEKIVLMSFLRARPDCGSPYHESKWEAEEIVRNSGLDYTILKAGVVYGRGDHMLDHLSHTLHTFPIFGLVGMKEKSIRPLAIEDLVHVMRAALIDRRLKLQTVAVVGPEEIYLSEAVRRVAEVVGKQPLMFPLPVVCHLSMASFFEWTMKIPLTSLAQVRILSEGVVEPGSPVVSLPYDLVPTRRFTTDQIRSGLPGPGPFCAGDLRLCS